jgi:hypothetical protein
MRVFLVIFSLLLAILPARADVAGFEGRTTLIMVDAIDCGYCRKWEREVGVGYPKSDEGRAAPLTKIRRGDARLQAFSGLAYTPTFILVVNGQERGRIVGYGGADFFWGELDRLIKRGPLTPDIRAETILPPRS